MVDADENRRLTETGPGTAAGAVLRSYWQPAALSEELTGERPVIPVELMGERLVLFRDETGELGLLEHRCAHRGADLSFGRLENGGLRCPFHGWLFDVGGSCLETPAEPEGSVFHTRVRQPSYQVAERNGIVWAWLGEGEPPDLPGYDCLVAPPEQVFAFKGLWECNWLQAHEVGIDPAHASYLHRFLENEDEQYGLQFRGVVADTGLATTQVLRDAPVPKVTAQPTSYGFRLVTLRELGELGTHVRVTNCLFPNAITIPMSNEMTITQWHVPIDDVSCYWYSMFVSYGDPVDADTMRAQRIEAVELPSYRPRVGRANNWGFDPAEQMSATYTGMGPDINVHDQWAVESPGPIFDRTREHLSPSDVGIRTHRRMLLTALADPSGGHLPGAADPASLRGPAAIDAVTTGDDHDGCWREVEGARRTATGWAPPLAD